MNLVEISSPGSQVVLDEVPGLELFDAHTHLGENDPDGMRQSPDELLAALRSATPAGRSSSPCMSWRVTPRPTIW